MAPESKTSLAGAILNDGDIVSYRSLSRQLKVHNNVAKQMLYEFHQTQNSKKPGSIHATYLLDGVPLEPKELSTNGRQPDGEDLQMQSSPYMSSSMPQEEAQQDKVPSKKVILAREEDFEEVKEKFGTIHSVHVYSLGPNALQNLQILSECNRNISRTHIKDDPLVFGEQYGVIQNAGVKRRTGKRPKGTVHTATVATTNGKANSKPQEAKASTQPPEHSERPLSSGTSSRPASQAESKPIERRPIGKSAPLRREQSDIFKSFSKPKAKLAREDTGNPIGMSAAPTDRASVQPHKIQRRTVLANMCSRIQTAFRQMVGNTVFIERSQLKLIAYKEDVSEEESEDDFVVTNKSLSGRSKSSSERQDALRRMMDDDEDEEMEDPQYGPAEASQESDPINAPSQQKAITPDPPTAVSGGRRRGRRKILKKKTIKDEEGYLVTKEEPAWESFSEDEPLPQAEKRQTSATASSVAKEKKAGGGKAGQGNIMSFFGKK